MAKTTLAHENIDKFKGDLGQCMKCGFCTFWCPIYQEERLEPSVARGKNVMIRGLLAGDLEYTKAFSDRLNKCTLCMACTANCPAKANIPNVIVAARADTARTRGLKFPYNLIYRNLVPNRVAFGNVVRWASWFQGVCMPKTEGTVRHLSLFPAALGRGRHIPSIAPKFLRQMMPVVNKPPAGVKTTFKAGYFTGCMTDFVFPELGKHIIEFLNRNGVEVVMPREQGCCSAPVFRGAGDFDTSRVMADANVKAFADLDFVVSDCATCVSTIKDYAKFLADTPERKEAYTKLGNKMKDISSFLVDVLKLPASAYQPAEAAKGMKVTWHDPCHLSRYLGVTSQPRQILKSLPGVQFVEMAGADRCCGMAGAFGLYEYELSKKIADKKVAAIKATGADIVASSCLGCEVQLIDAITRAKLPVKVMHLMELVQ